MLKVDRKKRYRTAKGGRCAGKGPYDQAVMPYRISQRD